MKSFCRSLAAVAAVLVLAAPSLGATLTALASFGNGDGWRAPTEIVAGDLAGTATGPSYNYLGTASLERGVAYNPATGNLILVSRSTAGNGIRVLNGTSGADVGALNQGVGVISGGTFTTVMPAVASDGTIYVANLQANVGTGAFKVYQWTSEGAASPTTFFNATVPGFLAGTPRLGDSLDVIGSGAGTTLVAGASGVVGYGIINSAGVATSVPSFVPVGPTSGDFRLGVTFGANANTVLGKQTSQGMELTSYAGAAGTSISANIALTSAGEAPMDYAVIAGVPILATIDVNNSIVRVYNLTNPAAPALLVSATTTSGTLTGNGNAVGSVKFGAITGSTAVLYAMSSNQGIQAFTLDTIPEPASLAMLALGALALVGARRVRGESNVLR